MDKNKAQLIQERISSMQAVLKLIQKNPNNPINPKPIMKFTPVKLITKAEKPKEPELR